jgi:hypothetical protein
MRRYVIHRAEAQTCEVAPPPLQAERWSRPRPGLASRAGKPQLQAQPVRRPAVARAGLHSWQGALPARHATLSSPGAFRAVAGIGLFVCADGLLALGIAVVVRHTAGAISVYVFVQLVLPIIVGGLPSPLQHQIERLMPLEIGSVMINNSAPDAFGPWTGFFILCGYTAAILALGTVVLVRRDA